MFICPCGAGWRGGTDAVFPQADGTDHDARIDVMDGMAMGADLAWVVVTLGDEDLRGTAAF